jgi:hypothetical protein
VFADNLKDRWPWLDTIVAWAEFMKHDTFCMLFVVVMAGALLPDVPSTLYSCVNGGGPVSVSISVATESWITSWFLSLGTVPIE